MNHPAFILSASAPVVLGASEHLRPARSSTFCPRLPLPCLTVSTPSFRPPPLAPFLTPTFCPSLPIPPYKHTDQRHCHRTRPGRLIVLAVGSNQVQRQPQPLPPLNTPSRVPSSHHLLPAQAKARFSLTPFTAHLALAALASFYGVYTCICRFLATPASIPALALYPTLPPLVFNVLRLAVSSCISVGLLLRPSTTAPTNAPRPSSRRLLAAGAELGAWNLGVNLAVVKALTLTPAPRVAFLAQTQIILVPLAALLFPPPRTPSSAPPAPASRILPLALLALVGSALLSLSGAPALGSSSSVGDAFAILSSIFYTAYSLRTASFIRSETPLPSADLTAVKNITQASFAVIHLAVTARPAFLRAFTSALPAISAPAFALNAAFVLFGGAVVSFCGAWIQIASLKFVPAGNAALILAFAPVVTAATAALIMGEVLGGWALAGAACIMCASVATVVLAANGKGKKRGAVVAVPRRNGLVARLRQSD